MNMRFSFFYEHPNRCIYGIKKDNREQELSLKGLLNLVTLMAKGLRYYTSNKLNLGVFYFQS